MQVNFNVGDTIKVYEKIKEGETASGKTGKARKERSHVFEGLVIAFKNKGENRSYTVRKIASGGIGVERIWPVNCPTISKVVIKKKGDVRRAKLYYLRKRIGKQALAVEGGQEKPTSAPPIRRATAGKQEKEKEKEENVENKPQ